MEVGQKIRNVHTFKIYTIVNIEKVAYYGDSTKTVYTVSNNKFESHRFNEDFLSHYVLYEEGQQ